MSQQGDMFEPPRKAELDQYFTEAWLARRAARWIPRGVSVLEPSCGSGNLIEGLVRAGHDVANIQACEIDAAWREHTSARFPGIVIEHGDFLKRAARTCGASLQNPPYGNELDVHFVERTLSLLDRHDPRACVVAILKTDFEYSTGRASLWTERAQVRRRAQLIERPRFGVHMDASAKKQGGAERNYVVLEMVPRTSPRIPGAVDVVLEERWSRTDPESCWTGPFAEVSR